MMMKMSVSCLYWTISFLVVIPLQLPWYCVTASFDITQLLSQYPAYSTFSNYLTQTQLARDINGRQNITVLAVDNSGMAPISGKPMDHIKKLLSVHVILDYLDVQGLQHLGNQTITVNTLFQTQGLLGFLKITDLSTGAVTFVSAADKNGVGANLIKAVVSQPYNVSVIQVSTVIMPPSLLSNPNAPSPLPHPVKSPVPVISPIPVKTPVPVISPIPVRTPVPVVTPVPVISPVPVPVKPPAPVPVPVMSPTPIVSPVPVITPVPVISPVPVVSPVPVATPVPVVSPVPVTNPGPGSGGRGGTDVPADSTPSNDPKSGVAQFGVDWALAILLTVLSIYMTMLSRPTTVHLSL